jgi:L-ectoine synthase
MIVRDFNKIVETERERVVSGCEWTSVRMLLADDGMGFSFHITFLDAGSEHTFDYKNHFESVYCMSRARARSPTWPPARRMRSSPA